MPDKKQVYTTIEGTISHFELVMTNRGFEVPNDEAYGAMSVLVEVHAEATLLGQVKKGSFRPPPKVDGGFVGFERRPPPLPLAELPAFFSMVRLAFGQRRKTLRNALSAGWGRDHADQVLAASGIDPRFRAEVLGLEELLGLYAAMRATPW